MAVLPSGQYWEFSDHGVLIEDWLFSAPNNTSLSKKSLIYDEIVPDELKLMTYFIYPMIPAISCLLAMINTINGVKIYTCQSPNKCRPRSGRLLHQLIAFTLVSFILTCIITIISLPKYFPIGKPILNEARQSLLDPPRYKGHFILGQLPALLTMTSTLRLLSTWLVIGCLADRFAFLMKSCTSPFATLLPKNHVTSKHIARTQNRRLESESASESSIYNTGICSCVFSCLLQCKRRMRNSTAWCAAKFCYIDDIDIGCCYNCRRNCELWRRRVTNCRKKRHLQALNHDLMTGSMSNEANNARQDFQVSSTSVAKSITPTVILGMCLSIVCLLTCLPQLSAYRLYNLRSYNDRSHEDPSIKLLWARTKSNWRLENNKRHALYEYYLASVTLLLPAFILFVTLCTILHSLCTVHQKISKQLHMSHKELQELQIPHENVVQKIVPWLIRDSWLITVIGILAFVTWIPSSIVSTSYQISLLTNKDGNPSNSVPWKILFCISEINKTFGDFIIQLTIIILSTCESKLVQKENDEQLKVDIESCAPSSVNMRDSCQKTGSQLGYMADNEGETEDGHEVSLDNYPKQNQTGSTNITTSVDRNSNSMLSCLTPNSANKYYPAQNINSQYVNENKMFTSGQLSSQLPSPQCSFSLLSGQQRLNGQPSPYMGTKRHLSVNTRQVSPRFMKNAYNPYTSPSGNSTSPPMSDRMQSILHSSATRTPPFSGQASRRRQPYLASPSPPPLPPPANYFASPTSVKRSPIARATAVWTGNINADPSGVSYDAVEGCCHSYADVDILDKFNSISPNMGANCVIFEEDETPTATMIGDTMDSRKNESIDQPC